MPIAHVQLFSIPVSDQDRALDFYVGVLGLEVVSDALLGPGMRWVQVAPRNAATSITLVTWFESMPPGSSRGTVLETDDLEGDLERLQAKGVGLDQQIQEQPWGRFFQIADPDGNGLIIQSTTGA